MTGAELYAARAALGKLWGRDAPIGPNELAKALGLSREHGGSTILAMERGAKEVTGPIAVAVTAMLQGFQPHDSNLLRRR